MMTGDGSSVGLFFPLPKLLAAQFPSLAPIDTSPSHVTLLYVGNISLYQEVDFALACRRAFSMWPSKLTATIGESGIFEEGHAGKPVFYQHVQFSQDLTELRLLLVEHLQDAGIHPMDQHVYQYNPHVTTAYGVRKLCPTPVGSWDICSAQVWGQPTVRDFKLGRAP